VGSSAVDAEGWLRFLTAVLGLVVASAPTTDVGQVATLGGVVAEALAAVALLPGALLGVFWLLLRHFLVFRCLLFLLFLLT
jgi:Na+(H+)/acetate symporter ActP